MQVRIADSEFNKPIFSGDVFKRCDNGSFYFLVDFGVSVELVSFNGRQVIHVYNSFDEAITGLTLEVQAGKLIHYSGAEYEMVIQRKGQ